MIEIISNRITELEGECETLLCQAGVQTGNLDLAIHYLSEAEKCKVSIAELNSCLGRLCGAGTNTAERIVREYISSNLRPKHEMLLQKANIQADPKKAISCLAESEKYAAVIQNLTLCLNRAQRAKAAAATDAKDADTDNESDKIMVETPKGTLTAQASHSLNRSGIQICLERPGKSPLTLCITEFSEDGGLTTIAWEDAADEVSASEVVYEGIDESFAAQGKSQYVYDVTVGSGLAIAMIETLCTGLVAENGDRMTQPCIIAKSAEENGEKGIGRTVSVSLRENKVELPENEWYYSLHVIDDVSGCDCMTYYTQSLNTAELMTLLGEILDSLDELGKLPEVK